MHHACISASKVTGTAVYNANGDKLGSIDDIVIDKLSGKVRYAALEFGGLFGIGGDRYPVPWNVLKYDTRLEGYVVPIRKEQLEKAPRYSKASSPMAATYTTTTASLGNSRSHRWKHFSTGSLRRAVFFASHFVWARSWTTP